MILLFVLLYRTRHNFILNLIDSLFPKNRIYWILFFLSDSYTSYLLPDAHIALMTYLTHWPSHERLSWECLL